MECGDCIMPKATVYTIERIRYRFDAVEDNGRDNMNNVDMVVFGVGNKQFSSSGPI